MATFILSVLLLPISIGFRYLDLWLPTEWHHPCVRMDPCGTRWGSWFQAVLHHISGAYLVFMLSAYLLNLA